MYRVTCRVEGVYAVSGQQAAIDITIAFLDRPWHQSAVCRYEDGGLTFVSENDFDFNGLATEDELSDEICANISLHEGDDGNLRIVRVEMF